MKKKLIICSPQLGLSPKSTLGGEVHDHLIVHGLAARGHKIHVLLPKNRPYLKHKNVFVTYAPIKHILALSYNLFVIPYLFKIYKQENFQVLRVHNPYYVGLGALLFKLFNRQVKIVATHHLKETSFLFDLINRLTAKHYDSIIAVSSYVKDWLVNSYSLPQEKISVIYNGVSGDIKPRPKNQNLIKKYNLEGKFVLLFMGLLIPRKNPMFLLDVFQSLKERRNDVALIICGDGPQENSLKKFIKQNNLKDVTFIKQVQDRNKVELFNLCDTFLFPSLNEGFGLVVAEAMACSKVVVASKNSSLNELIEHSKNGYLIEPNKLKDWTKTVEQLMTNPALKKSLEKDAIQTVKTKFELNKIIEKHERFYEGLINV